MVGASTTLKRRWMRSERTTKERLRPMNEIAQPHPLATRSDFHAHTGPSLESVGADPSRSSVRIPLNRTSCCARSFGNPQSRLFWGGGQLVFGLARDQAAFIQKLEADQTRRDV